MFNVISIIIGIVALVFVAIAFVPLLGLLNWFVIIVGVIRLMLGGGIL